MTRDELREQIDIMEALTDVIGACNDVAGIEFEPGERRMVNIDYTDSSHERLHITHSYTPHAVALAGLQAMRSALEQMLAKETV